MKTYRVAIYETLVEYVDINAENEEEAEIIAWDMIENGDVDITEIDYYDVEVAREIKEDEL